MKILNQIYCLIVAISMCYALSFAQSDISECKKDCMGTCNGTAGICNGICVSDPANCRGNEPPTTQDPPSEPPTEICPVGLVRDCAGVCGGTKQQDCLGVCDGTATEDCNRVCNGSADFDDCGVCNGNNESLDECGVCNGDGSSCTNTETPNNQCPVYSATIKQLGFFNQPSQIFHNTTDTPDCLKALVENVTDQCRAIINHPGWLDDCVSNYFLDSPGFRVDFWPTGNFNPVITQAYNGKVYNSQGRPDNFNHEGHFFFGSNCQPISPNNIDINSVCNASIFLWGHSPISIEWEENYNLEEESELHFSNFALNPNLNDKAYIWKASEKAPLLVYDPEHTGIITDGSQLFGEWTFGGKKYASLDQDLTNPTPWKNGFEALASLDIDGDKKLTDEELEPLGLWFDKNRNGISEQSEVKSLVEAKVIALKVTYDFVNDKTDSIIAEAGFKRIKDGKVVTGRSIDWYGKEAANKDLLKAKLGLKSALESDSSLEVTPIIKSEGKVDLSNPLSGIWSWKSNDSKSEVLSGFLGFKFIDDKNFTGHSYSELPLDQEFKKASSIGSVLAIQGQIIEETDQEIRLKFSTKAGNGLLTYLLFNKKQKTLTGSTTVNVSLEGKTQSFKYDWIAQKLK